MSDVIEFPAKTPPKNTDGLTQRLGDFIENPTTDISDLSEKSQKIMRLLASELNQDSTSGTAGKGVVPKV